MRPKKNNKTAVLMDAKSSLALLEGSHRTDLALHLYCAHLVRRVSYQYLLNNQYSSRKLGRFQNIELRTYGQLYWPSSPWHPWASSPSAKFKDDDTYTEGAPVLRNYKLFTDIQNPKGDFILENLPVTLVPGENEREQILPSATLSSELDASFQKVIHKRIHEEGKEVGIEQTPILPLQSKSEIFEMVNGLLDKLLKESQQSRKPKVKSARKSPHSKVHAYIWNWQDIISEYSAVEDSFGRCKRLFYDQSENVSEALPIRLDAQYLNFMQNFKGKPFKSSRIVEKLSDKSRRIPNNNDLIVDMLIEDTPELDEYTPMYNHIIKMIKERKKQMKRSRNEISMRSLKYLDKRLYGRLKRERAFFENPEDLINAPKEKRYMKAKDIVRPSYASDFENEEDFRRFIGEHVDESMIEAQGLQDETTIYETQGDTISHRNESDTTVNERFQGLMIESSGQDVTADNWENDTAIDDNELEITGENQQDTVIFDNEQDVNIIEAQDLAAEESQEDDTILDDHAENTVVGATQEDNITDGDDMTQQDNILQGDNTADEMNLVEEKDGSTDRDESATRILRAQHDDAQNTSRLVSRYHPRASTESSIIDSDQETELNAIASPSWGSFYTRATSRRTSSIRTSSIRASTQPPSFSSTPRGSQAE